VDEVVSASAQLTKEAKRKAKLNEKFMSVMSVDAVREDYWQSIARSTIRERCTSIFNQELLSDVNFIVRAFQGGSESKKIPAHKFVLAISSPVFFTMFYGELAVTTDFVEISDCDYESMLELFRFIYSDEANLNANNVMQLMYLAKKYMLPSLADKCSAYLRENLDASNVFHILPEAQKYDEKDLLDHCWKVIEKETDEAVKSNSFVTIERPVLEELVEKDSLNIKEVDLFKAVDCWAAKECQKQGLVAEGSEKRRILGERIVQEIRFPVMEEKDFAKVVLDCGILNKTECFDMMKYFNSVLETPVGFLEAKRAGYLKVLCRFKSFNTGWSYSYSSSNSITLTVDKNLKLHEVRLFGSENKEYSVTLTVMDVRNNVFVAIQKGQFLSKQVQNEVLGEYQGFDVVFKPPIALEARAIYTVKAQITGPPSWYGQSGLSRVEHSGVNFVFTNTSGSQTSYGKGQFSEFVFTLV